MRSSAKYQSRRSAVLRAAIASTLLIATPYAFGQSVSATLRGQVTADATPASGATVTATNTATGLSRTVQTGATGNYSLVGLPPGEYKIDVSANGKTSSQVVMLTVGQIATLDLPTGATQSRDLESVTVSATRLFEARTSEVSSYVSLKQIEVLPQSSRNFLEFADTIPGVQFQTSSDGSTELRSGGQSANGVNVFIDGVGQKNYVSRGGVGGQGSLADGAGPSSRGTRGNPFPQLAIGEYKVITSNYKAEFDQLSSAAIVAATKSGTNEFAVQGFYDKTSEEWRASDPFEARDGRKAPSEQEQYGAAIGGPIIQDRMHFFVTYEAKSFESPRRVFVATPTGVPAGTTLPPPYSSLLGGFSQPFEEDLVFAKIDWAPGDAHLFELSAKLREEEEEVFGDNEPPEHATIKDNQDARYDLRYQFTGDFLLNDAHITYEDSRFKFRPVSVAPGYQLFHGRFDNNNLLLTAGATDVQEERGQDGYGFQDDVTFNSFEWLGTHTFKTGVKYKKIDLKVRTESPYNPVYALNMIDPSEPPWRVKFGAVLPFLDDAEVESENTQWGLYLQDDWDLTDRLQVNLGVRYDYEETPGYLDYVTPADVVAGLNRLNTNAGGDGHPNPPPGQTYAQALALGGIDINDYISTGDNRSAFDSGIAPRFGFSFDLNGDERNVIFGGAGRAYDRNVFEYMARETFKGAYPTYERFFSTATLPCPQGSSAQNCIPWNESYRDREVLRSLVAANPQLGREVFMLNNDISTPYSDQYSIGIRNRIMMGSTDWLTSVAVSYVKSEDGIVFTLGNRWPDGQFRQPGTIWSGQPWGQQIPGLGSLILGNNGIETRTKQLLLSAEKPFTRESSWGATLAYTFSDAQENRSNTAGTDDTYIFDFATAQEFGWHQSTGVPKHRLVATGIYETPWPWPLTISSKLTLATPRYIDTNNCLDAPNDRFCFPDPGKPDHTLGFKQFDLAFQQQFNFLDFSLRLRADVLNVFNWANVDRRSNSRGSFGVPDPRYLEVQSYYQPTRTLKLSFSANWR